MNTHFSYELKIKGCSLAAEAKIIRRLEKRLLRARHRNPQCQDEAFKLRNHRIGAIRHEARDTLLAFGFMRGKTYKTMEPKRYSDPNWTNIHRLAATYGTSSKTECAQNFERWKQEASEPEKRKPRIKKTKEKPETVMSTP